MEKISFIDAFHLLEELNRENEFATTLSNSIVNAIKEAHKTDNYFNTEFYKINNKIYIIK